MFVYWVPFSSVPGVACCDFARKADGYNLPKIIGPWSSIRTFALMSGRNFATIPAYTHTHGRTWCAEIWMKASGNDVPVKFDESNSNQVPKCHVLTRCIVLDVFQLTSSCDVAFWILSVPKATCWWSFGNIGQELHSTEGNVIMW